ncbi:DUF2333 family protein [Aestuariirhabdus sp. Z084]|uniref:DUF2333 family protein n=1 Tax=Aestuariirhabdus haliotis TaxID=2918751 RepID=UPI00201B38ED|nr:DUF2333 family protein [Aestuariirhabdus haliotis]MCL6414925.1 DUF2333 family protein [Aestuariirhabdus haliotis]MCL6418857.1 DUF2333 family protein [Aestuariirhabdus haliotis]
MALADLKDRWTDFSVDVRAYLGGGTVSKVIFTLLVIYLLAIIGLGFYWSLEPDSFSVKENASRLAAEQQRQQVPGYTTTATLMRVAETLLEKPGGYLRNDVFPPGLVIDNMPSWEYGVLIQMRDLSRAMRKDLSRSQSQSKEDPDLAIAEPQFNFDANSWMLPSSEKEYRRGIRMLERYLDRLSDPQQPNAQFYTRADNLNNWLADVSARLGSLSQRLSASVGKVRINTDLAGDSSATQSTATSDELLVKTPWLQIDDVLYESRGSAWALIHFLKAIEIDFKDVLQKKNALVSLRQIIRELEATQETMWSPMVLNGSGFGVLANHSLVMASYISRANAAILDLRALLAQG